MKKFILDVLFSFSVITLAAQKVFTPVGVSGTGVFTTLAFATTIARGEINVQVKPATQHHKILIN